MNKLKSLFLYSLMAVFTLTSCDEDEEPADNGDDTSVTEETLSGSITSDMTLTSDKVWILDGRVMVEGGTLTIDPGTVIKANPGTGSFASALVITRDAKIMAAGTADAPIIFTTVADNIQPGEINSPNMDPENNGLWGGVIILGNAIISAQNDGGADVVELQVEGIPTSVDAKYGGSDDNDNSGVFTYVSIRHGGANIGEGNEINGLTLGGVGRGTTINNIEIVGNQDDGIEWFGGSVDMDNVVIWNSGDDGLDTDQDWIGTCTDFLIVTPRGGSAFELDGPEGSINRGTHQFTNGVVYAGDDIDHLVDWDGGTNAGVKDMYFTGFAADYGKGGFSAIESFGGDGTGDNSNWEYTAGTADADSIFAGADASILTEVSTRSNGPALSEFSWTWASASGALGTLGL